jgi:hypothetical protein
MGTPAWPAVGWLAYRRGWHRAIRRHPRTATAAALLGLAVLIPLGGYLVSPLWTRTELNEADFVGAVVAGTEDAAPVASGEFRGADAFHFGRGTVRVVETAPGADALRFEGFSVRNGPDPHVYLSSDPEGYAADALDLGGLEAAEGSFNHEIPAGIDPSRYRSVVIWCEPFSVCCSRWRRLPRRSTHA